MPVGIQQTLKWNSCHICRYAGLEKVWRGSLIFFRHVCFPTQAKVKKTLFSLGFKACATGHVTLTIGICFPKSMSLSKVITLHLKLQDKIGKKLSFYVYKIVISS